MLMLVAYACTKQRSCLLEDNIIINVLGHSDCISVGAIRRTSVSTAGSVEAAALHVDMLLHPGLFGQDCCTWTVICGSQTFWEAAAGVLSVKTSN